ncbi:MAG TPA: VOC family protein [Vicinamibacterales bacterium]|nr:VOC family protein [Vicinamibacterales bacterium]
MADSVSLGRFVWYDLMTTDPKNAESFYNKIAGWGTQIWNGPVPYTMWMVGTTPIGGVMAMPPGVGAPPHWLAYIATPDVDRTVKQAESLGGTTHKEPTDIPTVGRFAVLTDPQGAYFAAFTPAGETPGHDGPAAIGEISWHELMTTDSAAAWKFYEALFGWEKRTEHDMGPMGVYRLFGYKGMEIGGMFDKPAEAPGPPFWLHYIRVDNADRVADLVKTHGGTILNGPMDVPGGDRIAQCMDPQGAAFAIHSRSG